MTHPSERPPGGHVKPQNVPEHGPIREYQNYKLDLIGQGAENFVYQAQGHLEVVIKANKLALARALSWSKKHGTPPEDLSPEMEEMERTMLEEAREAHRALKLVFGKHVLPQKQFLLKVPWNSSMLHEMKQIAQSFSLDLPEKGKGEGWTIVSVQRRTDVLDDWHRLSMGGGALEAHLAGGPNRPIPKESWPLYAKVTDALTSRARAESASVTTADIRKLYAPTHFVKLIDQAAKDAGFRRVLDDFQRKAFRHAEETGDILDIIGADNIIFSEKKAQGWEYQLVDAIYPFEKRVLDHAKEALLSAKSGEPLTPEQRITIREAVGYVRTINALGKVLGTGAYIDFAPDDAPWAFPSLADVVIGRGVNIKKQEPPFPSLRSQRKGGLFGPLK